MHESNIIVTTSSKIIYIYYLVLAYASSLLLKKTGELVWPVAFSRSAQVSTSESVTGDSLIIRCNITPSVSVNDNYNYACKHHGIVREIMKRLKLSSVLVCTSTWPVSFICYVI